MERITINPEIISERARNEDIQFGKERARNNYKIYTSAKRRKN